VNAWRTLLPNAWYITVREFRSRVGTRSFLVGTILLAAIAFAVTQLPVLIDYVGGTTQTRLAVVVRTTGLPTDAPSIFVSQLEQSTGGVPSEAFAVSWLPAGSQGSAEQDLRNGGLDLVLFVDRSPATQDLTYTIRTDLAQDGATVREVESAAAYLSIDDRLVRAGTSLQSLGTQFTVEPVTGGSGASANSITKELASGVLSTGLIVLIFMAIVTYGTWVATSVAEEKGSRVMELMLNAATPLQMLTGKVVGNGAAGLLQYGLILLAVVVGLFVQQPLHDAVLGGSGSGLDLGSLSPAVLAAFIALFVTGFLLYALLYAGLGSLVSRQEDVQSATSPLMMLVFVGYFASIFALQSIDETWVRLLSFVPFFSPYIMLARVAAGHVEPWEFALTMAIMVAAIGLALTAAARIYSAGVLLYGQRVGLRQILRAARVSR
jgi:ABC-2 type transport system permease protein